MSPPLMKLDQEKNTVSQDGVGDLIGIVNKLQDKLAISGIPFEVSLPQIVVVGSQSAGKSSTLENVVGREFLPRGTGVVTRRPTVVQLIPCEDEYATFLHKPGVKFTDFHDVKKEIIEETNRNPGPVGFSSLPISLKIYSPAVLKLTLVDLPGLIRVTVDNQSEDSMKEIRNMVLEYISQPNCLILAVSPANQDIASSDALEIAKIVDPQRIRTIGVLTKLDLMDEGTDAREVLENKKIPLQRGYIGVLNRSQKDIENGKDIDYCLDKEARYFTTKQCYKDIADRMGTLYLRKTLNEQLYINIKEHLPAVRNELSQKLENARKELKEINDKLKNFNFDDSSGLHSFMISLTLKFVEDFHTVIFGHSLSVSMDELSAGAMINFKLYKTIQNFQLPNIPSQEKLLTTIANLHGVRNCFTMPSLALETVANQLLMMYIDPLNLLVNDIAETLDATAENSSKVLNYYPNFRSELLFLIRNSISEAVAETKETLEKHLRAEMYFVNTYHKDFSFPDLEANESLYPIKLWGNRKQEYKSSKQEYKYYSNNAVPSSGIDSEKSDTTEAMESIEADKSAKANGSTLAKTIEKYISIQQKHIEDMAFKYILYFLVKRVMDFVKSDLLGRILVSVDKEIICKDCKEDFNIKKTLESTCECLEDALNAVQTF